MGIFNDLEFKKRSGHIVVPDTDRVGGKTLTEFKNMFKAPTIIDDADGMITIDKSVLPKTITQESTQPDWVKYQIIAKNFSNTMGIDTTIKLLINGGDVLDKTGKVLTHNGVTVNNTIKKFGTGSLYFNGSSYITTPNHNDLDFGTGNFTIECWVKFSSIPNSTNWPGIITKRNSNTAGHSWSLWQSATGVGFSFGMDGVTTSTLSASLTDTTNWHHLACVRNGNIFTLYVDGVAASTLTVAGSIFSSTENIKIGLLDSASPTLYRFNGYIDDIRITKGLARYTSNFTVPTSEFSMQTVIANRSLTINGKQQEILSENNTGDIYFANTKLLLPGNDLTDKTGKVVTNTGVTVNNTINKFGTGSLYFNDVGSYLSVPTSDNFNIGSDNFTIEAWVYLPSRKTTYNATIFTTDGSNANGLTWAIKASGNLALWHIGAYRLTSINTIPLTTWTHVSIVRNNGIISFYINGTLDSSISYQAVFDKYTVPRIGNNSSTTLENFLGYMDDFRFTKGIARYTSNFIPSVNELQYGYTQTIFKPVMGGTRSLNVSYTGTLDSVDINTYILD